jgi:hypothetical protein
MASGRALPSHGDGTIIHSGSAGRRSFMIRSICAVAALAIGLAVAAPHPAVAAPSKAPAKNWASGTIEKFDAATRTLTVTHDGKSTPFVLDQGATIVSGKSSVAESDLTGDMGRKVRVQYVMNGGTRSALRVEVDAAHATKTAHK